MLSAFKKAGARTDLAEWLLAPQKRLIRLIALRFLSLSKQNMSQQNLNTVLFLCTANYYRSRFAEFYFNALASTRGLHWRAESRGLRLNLDDYGPICHETVAWLANRGIAMPSSHRYPIGVEEDDLQAAHLIVAVKEAEHRPLLSLNFPAWAERVEYWHVHDLDCAMPDEALPELAAKVEELVERLTSQATSQK